MCVSGVCDVNMCVWCVIAYDVCICVCGKCGMWMWMCVYSGCTVSIWYVCLCGVLVWGVWCMICLCMMSPTVDACACVLCAHACGMCALCACLICMWEIFACRWRSWSSPSGGKDQRVEPDTRKLRSTTARRIPSSGSEGKKEGFKKKQRLLGGQERSRGAAPNLVRLKAGQGEGFVQNRSLPLGVRPSPCRVRLMPVWADLFR